MISGDLTAQRILTALCVIWEVCDYVTQVTWKVTDTTMEHYSDKGPLEGLEGGLAPPRPRVVLDKQSGPEQWAIWKLAVSTRAQKNLGLGPDIA